MRIQVVSLRERWAACFHRGMIANSELNPVLKGMGFSYCKSL